MLLSSMRRWMNGKTLSFPHDSQRNIRNEKRSIRLRLEVLEDRCLPSGYDFTTLDVPGSGSTIAYGVNNAGQVVGEYNDGRHGFLLSGGGYSTLDVPGSNFTIARGLNASGQIVGSFENSQMSVHGFLLSGGSYTTLNVPGSQRTDAYGINDAGEVVGIYTDNSGFHGFQLSGGGYKTLDVPGSSSRDTLAFGINGVGQIVGAYTDAGGTHGFLLSAGGYTTLDVPGSKLTIAYGINGAGQIVGEYIDAGNTYHGFLYIGGSYTILDVPGSNFTEGFGINDAGQVVGRYDDSTTRHGFLASPTVNVLNLNDSGPGSLRQAIADAPPGGTVYFQSGLTGPITLTTGELLIDKDLTITGPGADVITVSGNDASRVFDIAALFTVSISGITVANGRSSVGGGGIANDGTLSITNSTLSSNSANSGGGITNGGTLSVTNSTLYGNSSSYGGGIDNDGDTLSVTNSTLSSNSAYYGGGIDNDSGTVRVTNSTLSSNSAYYGGGIRNEGMMSVTNSTLSSNSGINVGTGYGGGIDNDGTLSVTNSTFSGNRALIGGGILNGGGTASVTNSTFSGNRAFMGGGISGSSTLSITNSTLSGNSAYDGGGMYGTVTAKNVIVAGNTAGNQAPDVFGPLDSQGHNLIGDGTGGSGYDPTDLVGTSAFPIDPKLGPLQDNGGPTQTMALLPGSPAIDAGDNTDAPLFDQRGPGFPRIVNGTIDIGAFEVQAVALTVQCSVTVPVLWPPNHQLVNVGLSVQVSDPNATVTVQVYANDDALPSDAADLAPGRLRLRSQRQGSGSGRVYLIVVTATDAAGNVAVSVCTVVVPHDHSAHSLAAVEQQAADAEAYFQAFHTAPPRYRLLG
jgi:hypothetical protein